MAASPRWFPLLVLGLLVGLPGSLGSSGAESFSDSRSRANASGPLALSILVLTLSILVFGINYRRNGGGNGRRRLREGRPPANETAFSSMTERLVRDPAQRMA